MTDQDHFQWLCSLFVRGMWDKCRAFAGVDLNPHQRSRLGEAITADFRKLCDMVFPAARPYRISVAAADLARNMGVDLAVQTWHSQKKFDPGHKLFHYEHMHPVFGVRKVIGAAATQDEAMAILDRTLYLSWITKPEDLSLTAHGFAKHRDDPLYAYRVSGIPLLPGHDVPRLV
jgi:hypothetical protein